MVNTTTIWFEGCNSFEEIKKSFRQLCFEHHPDKGGTAYNFINLQEEFKHLEAIKDRVKFPLIKSSSGKTTYRDTVTKAEKVSLHEVKDHEELGLAYIKTLQKQCAKTGASTKSIYFSYIRWSERSGVKYTTKCLNAIKDICNYQTGWIYYKVQELKLNSELGFFLRNGY